MKSTVLFSLCLLALLCAGCGSGNPATYPVQGKVLFSDGSPLNAGTVEFRSKNPDLKNLNARGSVQPDGTFTLSTYGTGDGAVEGEHDVVVIPKPIIETRPNVPTPPDPIDMKYREYTQSGLAATVKAGAENKVELKVTPPAPLGK